jgi:hypothetical protein
MGIEEGGQNNICDKRPLLVYFTLRKWDIC